MGLFTHFVGLYTKGPLCEGAALGRALFLVQHVQKFHHPHGAHPGCSLGIRVFFRNDPCKLRKFIGHTVAFRLGAVHTGAAAAHAAQCDDIVAKLPDGLDTVVGAKGIYLSGGECQRVALARAILKDAPIVVLDEATAFADPENEALIQRALARLCEGKTVLMIAHRLSTVTGADVICVLDGGRVVERGRHDELVAAGGPYAKMWDDYRTSVTWRIERSDTHAA